MNDIVEKLSYPTLIQQLQPTPVISRLSNTQSNILNTYYTQNPVEVLISQEKPSVYYTGNNADDKGISPTRTMIPTYDKYGNLIVIPSYRYKQNMIWSIPTSIKTTDTRGIINTDEPEVKLSNVKIDKKKKKKKTKKKKIEKYRKIAIIKIRI